MNIANGPLDLNMSVFVNVCGPGWKKPRAPIESYFFQFLCIVCIP